MSGVVGDGDAAAAVVVLCTVPAASAPGQPAAADLARQLVGERLCACVNLVPGVQSLFWWQGAVDSADEVLLIAKTTAGVAPRLQARIAELHPYAVPEVLLLPAVGGLPAYLDWIRASVRPSE